MDIARLPSIYFQQFQAAHDRLFYDFWHKSTVILNKKMPKITMCVQNVSPGILIKSGVLYQPELFDSNKCNGVN